MNHKLLLFIIVIVIAYSASAQKDTIHYNILKDDPYELAMINLELSPLVTHYDYASYLVLGFSAGVSATLFDKVDLHSNYTMEYFNLNKVLMNDGISDIMNGYEGLNNIEYNPQSVSWFEIGASIRLSDQMRNEEHYLTVHSQQTGNIIINNVINIESKYRKIKKLRGGFIQTKTNENYLTLLSYKEDLKIYANYDDSKGALFNAKGVTYDEINYTQLFDPYYDGISTPDEYDYNENEYSNINAAITVPYSANIYYFGYGSEKIMNAIIDIEGHGKRYKRFRIERYIDILYGAPEYGSFSFYKPDVNATYYEKEVLNESVDYNIDFEKSGFTMRNFGFRVGVNVHSVPVSKYNTWEERAKADQHLIYGASRFSLGMLPSYQLLKSFFVDYTIILTFNPK
jgi:hypothetical protein